MRQNDSDERMDKYERHLREQIAIIHDSYQRAIEPLVKELVRIEALRPRHMHVTPEQLEQLGLVVKK